MLQFRAIDPPRPRSRLLAVAATAVIAIEAISFVVAAVSHAGVQIPLGFATLNERVIVPAAIVESLCAAVLVGSAITVIARRPSAWGAVLRTQLFVLAAVIVGISALAGSPAPVSTFDSTYHGVLLAALLIGVALLFTPTAKRALRSESRPEDSAQSASAGPRR
jgi:hypothetical protein